MSPFCAVWCSFMADSLMLFVKYNPCVLAAATCKRSNIPPCPCPAGF
eukprot:CAMPEP_0172071072 /NCGR_PEP_ID=MMETSP1043-20130122/13593_1 /TAXON_ID=464988 /ORGANISM="Hemiselmis andersenii, Strain CCMP441" /LENGTH=46 /DNA_ID= /DNA_START= /DNA_END= /DNA_ORIENTATION=